MQNNVQSDATKITIKRKRFRMPIVTILIAFTSASLFYALGAIPVQLIWHSGEHQIAWQWLTAHFSHISDKHLMWNLCALLILGTVIEDTSRLSV